MIAPVKSWGCAALAMVALLGWVACGGEEQEVSSTPTVASGGEEASPVATVPSEGQEASPTPTPSLGEESPLGNLEVRLTVSDPAPHVGVPLEMTLTLENRGREPERLPFATSQRYDFIVKDQDGNEVWRWSADKLFAQVLGEETLAPGGTLSYGETWAQRDNSGLQVAPGQYMIEGVIVRSCPPNARCLPLVASATLQIAQQ